ncbi:inactive ubiquitin thioesterase FAM105A [Elysia marginata]|uniref:Inactive ubiquitin thioesterase FAM105A n=1 Tax=Elysia marginata TaxID=1093978 RepID=A0AAV4JR23_9GAST|nr:inactive ubiquitin thioesterase FAM105A [Elysia marginata]
MGNTSSKRQAVPSVYYSPGYGVSVGARPPSLCTDIEAEEDVADNASSNVRLRPRRPAYQTAASAARRKSPSPASDKDSAIGGTVGCGSEMSQSMYSELSNRDSFYSTCTAESGFDDLGFLDDLRNGATASRLSGSPGSLKENFSPNSLRERNIQMLYRAHHGYDAGLNSLGRSVKPGLDTLSDCSSECSGIISSCSVRSSCDGESTGFSTKVRTNKDPLLQKLASNSVRSRSPARTCSQQSQRSQDRCSQDRSQLDTVSNKWDPLVGSGFLSSGTVCSNESSPHHTHYSSSSHSRQHQSPLPAAKALPHGSPGLNPLSDCGDYDLDASESIRSFNSSADEDIDWNTEDYDDDVREMMSTVPPLNQSLTDIQFKESLMQRIHEWSSFAEEYNKSRSPTPGSSPLRFVRRSRSLDRHMGDPGSVLLSDAAELAASKQLVEIEPTTERSLETLEYELQDIQGEFESITSKLHELIEQGGEESPSVKPASGNNASPKSSIPQQQSSSHKPPLSQSHKPQPSHSHHSHHYHKLHSTPSRGVESAKLRRLRTKWQRVPSSACSNSSRSSRASSVEYAWDLADYSTNLTGTSGMEANQSSQASPSRGAQLQGETTAATGAEVINIAPPVNLATYAEQEWKGNTDKARLIRQGYSRVPGLLACHRVSVVRGDNYCGLRSVLFQVLSSGLRVTRGWSGIIGMMDSLHGLYNGGQAGLSDWTFAHRLPGHCSDRLASMSKCVLTLYATIEEVCNLPTQQERERRTMSLLNTGATFDLELMEGLKIMMLLTLSDLHRRINDGEDDVPIFAHLLFARDSSQTVADFLRNHLNAVGDSAGLEQVEMCLLGFALGVKIRVLRLAQIGQQDFDCVFPEDVPSDWPVVSLIAEDDRHYNVPLPMA